MVNSLLKQSRGRVWLGAMQVQLASIYQYINPGNTLMIAITFWYSAGSHMANRYASWFSMELFLAAGLALVGLVMYLDYKLVLPSRQRFLNEQACKHENPAMVELRAIREDIQKIKTKLGINNENT